MANITPLTNHLLILYQMIIQVRHSITYTVYWLVKRILKDPYHAFKYHIDIGFN